jgi:O-succinylbenzoate synthase
MTALFVATHKPKPDQLAVFYVAADSAKEAKTIVDDYAKQREIKWDALAPLPGLQAETLKMAKGQIKEWPVGELLNPLKLIDPLK